MLVDVVCRTSYDSSGSFPAKMDRRREREGKGLGKKCYVYEAHALYVQSSSEQDKKSK